MSEESEDDLSRLEKERVWIVDPLDGTGVYRATEDFVVQIALTVGGQPVLGVVYQPTQPASILREGQGAYQVCRSGHPSPVSRVGPGRMCL